MKKKLWICVLTLTMLILTVPIVPTNACRGRRRPIIILRDDYGVPHIYARTKEGLAYGCGYAMAQDRLWQAEVFRRAASGRLAEVGLATVDDDYATRAVGYSWEELGEMFDNWVPTKPEAKLKEMMLAFVDGVNLYITEAIEDPSLMPVEYLLYDFLPEPWTIEDSAAIMGMMAWRFGGCGGDELKYAAALMALQAMYGEKQGMDMFNDHFPQNDPGAEVTIPDTEAIWSDYLYDGCDIELPENIMQIYQEYEEAQKSQEQLLGSLGLPTKFGSNAWMVSPSKSETGNALQVGGPQMGQSIPQILMEVGLHGAGIDAVGAMIPMGPVIILGVSKYGAWTSTTGVSDVMDTYIEVLNPLNSTQYWHDDGYMDMEMRIETIVDGEGTPHNFPIYRTIHGPIIGMDFSDPGHPLAFTMKTPYYKNDLAAEEGWFLFQQAKNIWDFQEACKTIQPAHNFYWIDKKGNIGYWHAGTFPIKPTYGVGGRLIDDRFPLNGTGEEEWVGLTGFAEMPKCINPSQSWLANWNNKPITNWPFGESDAGWGEGHRVKRIFQLLSSKDEFSFEDMNLINMDAGYNHIPGMNLLKYLVDAARADLTIPREVVHLLEDWNHHYNDFEEPRWPNPNPTYDDPGLTIFDAWYERIFDEVFNDDIPPYPPIGPIHREFAQVWPSTIIHVFDGPDSKLPLKYDYLNKEDRDTVIVRVLKEAIDYLNATHGPDITTWLTPVKTITFDQQGALPAPTMHAMNRGTYNHIVEMITRGRRGRCCGRYPHAVNVIPPGQSGFMNYLGQYSPHAYDQLLLYETWTYKPVRFRFGEIRRLAESWEILFYPKPK